MADVYIVVFSLLGILVCLPALLVALNLILPRVTEGTAARLSRTPGKCFFLGVPVAAAFLLWIAVTSQINLGPVKATAFVAAIVGMGLGTVGAAGLARLIGDRLKPISATRTELGNLVRGAFVFELACLVPIVGWFLFAPLVGTALLGASVFAFLGWITQPLRQAPQIQVGAAELVNEQ